MTNQMAEMTFSLGATATHLPDEPSAASDEMPESMERAGKKGLDIPRI
ncbi:MAG: hypothetical protein AAB215_02435 [Planctomycetota bacterium]